MYRIIGLVGPSGCGKDTAANWATELSIYNKVKLCTTRPKRDTEKGDEYLFLESEDFLEQVLNGNMLNAQEFRGWYYGLSKDGLSEDIINIVPMSVTMVEQMLEENNPDIDLQLIYINTPNHKQRLEHMLKREKNPDCVEICRRFLADWTDYVTNEKLQQKCACIINNNYDADFMFCLVNAITHCRLNFQPRLEGH